MLFCAGTETLRKTLESILLSIFKFKIKTGSINDNYLLNEEKYYLTATRLKSSIRNKDYTFKHSIREANLQEKIKDNKGVNFFKKD
jgi:hypothetical protein